MIKFTPGELEVMQILWQSGGPLKPAEIQERFSRPIKNPALRSYLSILMEKGHVVRTKVGKAYHYEAKTKQESTFRSMLREMVDSCFQGSTEALMAQLIRSEKLSHDDLKRLKEIADQETKEGEGNG